MAENNEQLQKVFVGGLHRDVGEDALSEAFKSYGRIIDVTILRDSSRRSRGFGFVTFENPSSVDDIMKAKKEGASFLVREGLVEVKRALPKVERSELRDRAFPRQSTNIGVKKIFIGGLASSTTSDDLENYFNKFGRVLESSVLIDKITTRSRGFGFVVFEEEDTADKVCALRNHTINGKVAEVRKAEPRSALMNRRERETIGAAAFRSQSDSTRQQQALPSAPLDVGNLSSAIQVLNSIQNLLSAAQLQQLLSPNQAVANQSQGLSFGASQFGTPASNVALQSSALSNQNNILQLLQTALNNQNSQIGMQSSALSAQNSSHLSNLLGNSAPTGGLAGPSVNALGLLSSLAGMNSNSNVIAKQEGNVSQSTQSPSLNSVPGSSAPVSSHNFAYYDDAYATPAQSSSAYGPVRYPPRTDSKPYRPY